jgi:hypothetical protein
VELNIITDALAKAHQDVARRPEKLRDAVTAALGGGRVSRIQRRNNESSAQKR